MPEEKKTVGFRLSHGAQRRLEYLAAWLETSPTQVVETALKHLHGSLIREQGVWLSDPPPETPDTPKRPNDAA